MADGSRLGTAEKALSLLTAALVLVTAGLGLWVRNAEQGQAEATAEVEQLTERIAALESAAEERRPESGEPIRETLTDGPSLEPSPAPAPAPAPSIAVPDPPPVRLSPVYLAELEPFTEPSHPQIGTELINRESYPSSYTMNFRNCGSCVDEAEFEVPEGYNRFIANIGLTDDSRSDDVIDGLLEFAAFAGTTRIFGPIAVSSGEVVVIDEALNGASTLRIVVGEGTNFEYACWCSARFEADA